MTSNEIEQYNSTPGELAPTPPATENSAITVLMQHAEAMNVAYELADKMCRTSIVPAIYRQKPDDATAAILYGAEIGLNPIQSLQNVFPVHGMPSIYTRTMVAIVKSKGHKVWTVESSDESVTVAAQRRNESYVEESTWTLDRAVKAGYVPTIDEKTGKYALNGNGKLIGNEKYLKDPQAMLYAKAAAEVCRKIAPDILLGIAYTSEELELENSEPVRVKSERVSAPKGLADLDAKLGVTASNSGGKPEPSQAEAPKARAAAPKAEAPAADPKATKDQLERLNELLTNEKLETKEDKLAWLEGQFGRKFKSSAELLEVEAASVIEFLAAEQAADASKSDES